MSSDQKETWDSDNNSVIPMEWSLHSDLSLKYNFNFPAQMLEKSYSLPVLLILRRHVFPLLIHLTCK